MIVADKDEPGLKHAADVYRSIVGVVDSVKIAQARAGKDASDHLDSGFAVEELEQLEPGELPMADDTPAASKTEDADDHLPDAFWNARPELAHIRQAAYARTRTPMSCCMPCSPVWLRFRPTLCASRRLSGHRGRCPTSAPLSVHLVRASPAAQVWLASRSGAPLGCRRQSATRFR